MSRNFQKNKLLIRFLVVFFLLLQSCDLHKTTENSTDIDLFLLAGQSNAWGVGDASLAPRPAANTCYVYCNTAVHSPFLYNQIDSTQGYIAQAFDPTIVAVNMASIIPAFAVQYYSNTHHKIGFLQWGIGASSLMTAAGATTGNWGPDGTHRYTSILLYNDAIQKFTAAGLSTHFKGIIWMQGEAEAGAFGSNSISETDYEAAFLNLISFYKGYFGDNYHFIVVQTGTQVGSDDTGYAKVRNVQKKVCVANTNARMLYDRTYLFPQLGWMNPDTIHYNQYGLNDIGTTIAKNYFDARFY